MKVEFSKRALKFLKKLDDSQTNRIRSKIKLLKISLEQQKALPFDELDIKKLKGNWLVYFRIRVGTIRIVFTVRFSENTIIIYDICFRGNAYV